MHKDTSALVSKNNVQVIIIESNISIDCQYLKQQECTKSSSTLA